MITINCIFVFLSIILFISFSYEVTIESNGSILYDANSIKKSYKVGDIFEFTNYVRIKDATYPKCMKLYKGFFLDSTNSIVKEIDYYFSEPETIRAIIPDVDPGTEYSIAIQINKNNPNNYLYSKRFDVAGVGIRKIIGTGQDKCGYKRKSLYSDAKNVIKIPLDSTPKLPHENLNKEKPTKNSSKSINSNNAYKFKDSHSKQNDKLIDDKTEKIDENIDPNKGGLLNDSGNELNTTNTYMQPPQPISLNNQKLTTDTKSNSTHYILVFFMGVLFCALLVGGFVLINKRGKKNKEKQLGSVYSENPSEDFPTPKLPLDYGYNITSSPNQSPVPNNNSLAYNNDGCSPNNSLNRKANTIKSERSITDNSNILTNSRNYSLNRSYRSIHSNRSVLLNNASSPLLADNRLTLTSETSLIQPDNSIFGNSVIPQNYPAVTTAAAVSMLEPVEAPSTEIKFVATSSYEPKNENEIKISSLDIVYLVGYVDEQYAQILNITTNNYGIIPVSELNKIQP